MSDENREFNLQIYEELKAALEKVDYTMLTTRPGSENQVAIRIDHPALDQPIEVAKYRSQTENAILGLVRLVALLEI